MKTCRYAVLALLGVLITLICLPLSAQEIPDVRPDDRVRVQYGLTEARQVEGRFHGITDEAVLVFPPDRDEVFRIPISQVRDLQVHRAGSRSANRVMAGALLGGGALAILPDNEERPYFFTVGALLGAGISAGPRARKSILIGGAKGAVTGTLLGLSLGGGDKEDWFYIEPHIGALVGAAVGAVVLGSVGAAIGLLSGEDHWESVSLPTVQLSPVGRFGFRLSIPTRG